MKLKKLIASVLAFTMVGAIPNRISHAENNPTPESFATIEDSINSEPHMKNAIENIRKIQEDYNKTFFARKKHNIIKNRLNIVESELKAYEKSALPENQKTLDALRFEKEFLTTLKQNTEDPFCTSVLKYAVSGLKFASNAALSALKIVFPLGLSVLGYASGNVLFGFITFIWGTINLCKLFF